MKPSKLHYSFLCWLLFFSFSAYAQNKDKVNDSLFTMLKTNINAQNSDAVYALLSDDFKAKFSNDKVVTILKTNLYPMGEIKETSFIASKDGVSCYKTVCANAVLEFKIGADDAGKIAHMQFLPYKEPVATKNHTVPSDNPMRTMLDKRIDSIARNYINKVSTVGLSIGVVKNGNTYTYGYGATAKEGGRIPNADAIFEIGSISKTFTATLLAYYAVDRKVSLTDPITKYLPDSVAANKNLQQVTLRMLANHTSGLPRLPSNLPLTEAAMANPYKDYDHAKLFDYLKNCELSSTPGEKYAYSNLGAGLLGAILERVSHKTYDQMVVDVICRPLGMNNTMQHIGSAYKERLVKVYNDKAEPVMMWDMDALAGAGALRSSANDLLIYAQANMMKDAGKLSQAMDLTHGITYDKEITIGLGWHMGKNGNDNYLWHNGGTGGSSSYMAFSPDNNIAVVVLSNSTENTDAVGQDIFKLLDR